MNIENLIKEEASEYGWDNYHIMDGYIKAEVNLITATEKAKLSEIFESYNHLRYKQEMLNMEKAYIEGFKKGLKFMTKILNLDEPTKNKLKEASIGKRAS